MNEVVDPLHSIPSHVLPYLSAPLIIFRCITASLISLSNCLALLAVMSSTGIALVQLESILNTD